MTVLIHNLKTLRGLWTAGVACRRGLWMMQVNIWSIDPHTLTPLIFICDLWPHQQMRVPMLHPWPNFDWNLSKHLEVSQMLTCFHNRQQHQQTKSTDNNNSGQSDPYCVFPAKAGDTKTARLTKISMPFLSSLDNLLKMNILFFKKSSDNFEIAQKTC